jgi:transcription antitermination factor NusA-like protein
LIVLRQERDEINSALFNGKQEIARLRKVEQEKQALLCEMKILLDDIQNQSQKVKIFLKQVNPLFYTHINIDEVKSNHNGWSAKRALQQCCILQRERNVLR